MLQLSHVSKSFQGKVILDDISISLQRGDITALVGANGAGKTTLLTILLGIIQPDSGSVSIGKEIVGYIPQEVSTGRVGEHFEGVEAWRRDYALSRLKLDHIPLDTFVSSLSGGQRTRLALAKALAAHPEPTVLLLDEPTNNLDAEGLAWLEEFIKGFDGSILLVSHDRTLINAVATRTIELHNGKITQYGGNYDFYKEQKQIEFQAAQLRYEHSVEERKRIEKGMRSVQDRARQGIRRKRPKDNDKAQFNWHQDNVQRSFSGQLKAVQSRLNQLEEVARPVKAKVYSMNLEGKVPNHKRILALDSIQKTYTANRILRNINLELFGSERAHIAGSNGSGKTTLLKIAAGLLQPDSGTVTWGAAINVGYFSQDINRLDHERTALENLQVNHLQLADTYQQARSLGLTQSDLQKTVSSLSRGQQAKLGFTKLLLGMYQLLILDEPTNHLDIPTREEIEGALSQYKGAILFTSHDNYFTKTLQPSRTLTIINGELR